MSLKPFDILENTWNFSNSSFPKYRYKIPVFPYLKLGKAERGLCGGMVFTALDYYYANKRIPDIYKLNTEDNDTIFRNIVKRLFHSFTVQAVLWYYYLQLPFVSSSFKLKHTSKQLPKIIEELKQNKPVPITLILIKSYNPDRLGENHQVLLTQLTHYTEDFIEFKVYDPNLPKKECYMQLKMQKENPTQIKMNGVEIFALQRMRYKVKKV